LSPRSDTSGVDKWLQLSCPKFSPQSRARQGDFEERPPYAQPQTTAEREALRIFLIEADPSR
jgi:hypothetical protein